MIVGRRGGIGAALLGRDARRPGRLGRLDADVAAGVVARQEVAAARRGALHLHAAAAKAHAAFLARGGRLLSVRSVQGAKRLREGTGLLQTKGYGSHLFPFFFFLLLRQAIFTRFSLCESHACVGVYVRVCGCWAWVGDAR